MDRFLAAMLQLESMSGIAYSFMQIVDFISPKPTLVSNLKTSSAISVHTCFICTDSWHYTKMVIIIFKQSTIICK